VKTTTPPKVTVLMPVFNGEKYIEEAIESILKQTFTDFELLIIDDNSTDKSMEIISTFKDKRLRIKKNHQNKGLAKTLNFGLNVARGKYIARMDQDDISYSSRLEKQVEVMDRSSEFGLVSTNCYQINSKGDLQKNTILKNVIKGKEVEWYLLWGNPIVHPSVMFRTELIKSLNGYPETFKFHVEDYVLWNRLIGEKSIVILDEPLLLLRKHNFNATEVDSETHIQELVMVMQQLLDKRVGYEPLQESIHLIGKLPNKDQLTFFISKSSVKLLIDSYRHFVFKHSLDEYELKGVEFDLAGKLAQIIKANILEGNTQFILILIYILFLVPNRILKELNLRSFLYNFFQRFWMVRVYKAIV
tara:strand:+ start:25056 stop:26132 length:1077 start_codon:yes stop_codon:yes gene_type:complete